MHASCDAPGRISIRRGRYLETIPPRSVIGQSGAIPNQHAAAVLGSFGPSTTEARPHLDFLEFCTAVVCNISVNIQRVIARGIDAGSESKTAVEEDLNQRAVNEDVEVQGFLNSLSIPPDGVGCESAEVRGGDEVGDEGALGAVGVNQFCLGIVRDDGLLLKVRRGENYETGGTNNVAN